jgi:hypothetical protein
LKKFLFSAALLLLIASQAFAQYYYIGEEPSGVKWQIAKSGHFSLIFPYSDSTAAGKVAKRYLNLMELNYGSSADSLGLRSGLCNSFPMVLHTYNAKGNGVTVWAPRQIDFYGIPSAYSTYPQKWEEQLVLHEGRHAWQIAHFTKGIYKYLYWFMGDQITGGASGIYPSRWMLEGDAVVAETERSNAGRGRSGSFLAYYLLDTRVPNRSGELKERTWDQWRFGSVKNYTPNHYALGYWINSAARYETKDYKLADKIFTLEAKQFWNVNVVSNAFETYTGKSHRDYVRGAEFEKMKSLYNQTNTQSDASAATLPFEERATGAEHGYYVNYDKVTVINPDSVLVVYSGYGSSSYLALLQRDKKDGAFKSKVLRYFSSSTSNLLYKDGKIWWSEIVPNPRWQQVDYSQVYSYDLKNGTTSLLKEGTYWYNPSGCKDYLVLTEYNGSADFSKLLIVNPYSVSVYRSKSFRGQILETASVGTKIFMTAITDDGEGLYVYDGNEISESAATSVIAPQHQVIKRLRSEGRLLYFISDFSGSDMLYCYDTAAGKTFRACDAVNVSSAQLSGEDLYYTAMKDAHGFKVYKSSPSRIAVPGDSIGRAHYVVAEELSGQYKEAQSKEPMERLKKDMDADSVTIGNYNKLQHLLKLHSWAPVYYDVNSVTAGSYDSFINEAAPGVTLYSQNTLGTAVGMVGYSYLHGRSGLHAKFSYTGFYPVFEMEAHYNDAAMTDKNKHSIHTAATLYIPWRFNSGGWNRGFIPQVLWSYRNDQKLYTKLFIKKNVDRQQLIGALRAYCMLPVSKAQIYPKWGIGASVRAGFNPNGGNKFGSIYSGYVYGYVPGIFWNQGIKLSAGYQYQDIGGHTYWLGNQLDMPRGMDEEYGTDYYKLSADYAIPLYLGDVSLGCFAYLKRLQIIPFADYARIKKNTGWSNMHAIGGDIIVDGHFFRIGYPVSLGFRYANNGGGHNYGALLFSITFD